MKFILIFLSFSILLTLFGNSQELPGDYERTKIPNFYKKYDSEPDSIWAYEKADFIFAEFDSVVSFSNSKFESAADFYFAEFDSIAGFSNSKFESAAVFSYAEFASIAYFYDAEFASIADFQNAGFASKAFFQYANFESVIDLTYARIEKNINFDFAVLPDTILINGATINGRLDFSYARPKDSLHQCKIDFYQTNIDNLILDYSLFEIIYSDTIKEREVDKLYTDLLRVQEKHNFKKGYEKLDIEYHKFKSSPFSYWIRKLWDNFGYNKKLIFRNTAILLGLCFLIVWFFFEYLVLEVYCPESLSDFKQNLKTFPGKKGFKRKMSITLYAFYYTLIIFFGLKMDLKNFQIKGEFFKANWKKRIGVALIFSTYLLGIVCTAYLANFIITR